MNTGEKHKVKGMVMYRLIPENATSSKWKRLGVFRIVLLMIFVVSFYIYGQDVKPDAVADSLNTLGGMDFWKIFTISLLIVIPILVAVVFMFYFKYQKVTKNGNSKPAPAPAPSPSQSSSPNGHIALHQIDERIKEAAKGFNLRLDDLRDDFAEVLTSMREVRENQEENTKSINDLKVEVAKSVGESKRNDGKQFLAIKNIELKLFGTVITTDDDDRKNSG